MATAEQVGEALRKAAAGVPAHKFTARFLLTEWREVVDAWQLASWEGYRDVQRLGRKTRLPEAQRALLWEIFAAVRADLSGQGLVTEAGLFTLLAEKVAATARSPFDFAVVDEAQDVSIAQLQLLAALGRNRAEALFFAGDLGQRIFQQPFSWKALGVDVRGRSTTLKINYRTSHQIRAQADRLLGATVADVDGITEERKGTTSVFNGPAPRLEVFGSKGAEVAGVGAWLRERVEKEKLAPHEVAVFVRSEAELERARAAVEAAGLKAKGLDARVEVTVGDRKSVV